MYFILDSLLKLKVKKTIGLLVFYIIAILLSQLLEKGLTSLDFKVQGSFSFIYFQLPSILMCWFLLFKTKTRKYTKTDLIGIPHEEIEPGKFIFFVPTKVVKMGVANCWIEGVRDRKNTISLIFSFLLSPLYLFLLLWLYIKGYDFLSDTFSYSFCTISVILISIQGKIIFLNYSNAGELGGELSWFRRIKARGMNEIIVSLDLIFISLTIVFNYFNLDHITKVLLFIYGFRIMRILLLIPYFEYVWDSITRGLRLTTNYVSSFLVILIVFSLNSRMLFGETSDKFSTLTSSIYNNFQIILGNGFDIGGDSSEIESYVFFVTLLLGIIFTSIITALITDSILAKKNISGDNTDEEKSVWYKRDKDEDLIFYAMRVVSHVIKI